MRKAYRIISIEAADIYRQEQENGGSVGYKMPENKSDAYFKFFKIYLDNSLDLIELEKAYARICRKKFSFQDKKKNEYTLAVINLKFNYTYKPENGKPVKIKDLRAHFYENGFYLDGVHYVRYKRSAGSSREGKCLFIDERLYKAMDKWSGCGLKVQTDLASWESYKALSLSSIKGTINIPLDGILFVPDYKSIFTEEVVSVELKDGKLVSEQKQTEIINDIWDGESLLDESVFENGYADKHMLLLRNKFFKSCAFRTRLQKWIKDKNITIAGGATAAARIRRLDERAEIIIFERSGFISYANCGLPYYVGGVIEDKGDLSLQTPESFFRRFKIVAKVHHEVTDIDVQNKTVSVTDLKTGTSFTESYDKLILSPGAKPILPDFYNENERTFTLRTVEDALKIRAFVEQKQPKTAVVIGGGFIGLEMAENLAERGIKTTVIQRGNHLLPTVDCDMSSFIHANFRYHGVQILLNSNTEKLTVNGDRVSLELADGNKLNADMVVLSIGVAPENTLAKKAGLELGIKGAIKVNAKMQTSLPDIYAVGDAVQVKHFITEQDSVISLAGPANKQGRIVADNICGLNSEYKGSQAYSWASFGLFYIQYRKPCSDEDDPNDKVRNKLKHYNLLMSFCDPGSESYRKLQKEKDEWLKSLHLDENKILDIGSDYL